MKGQHHPRGHSWVTQACHTLGIWPVASSFPVCCITDTGHPYVGDRQAQGTLPPVVQIQQAQPGSSPFEPGQSCCACAGPWGRGSTNSCWATVGGIGEIGGIIHQRFHTQQQEETSVSKQPGKDLFSAKEPSNRKLCWKRPQQHRSLLGNPHT